MPRIELLWSEDCPNRDEARALLVSVVDDLVPGSAIEEIDASDAGVAAAHRFPGSPTIRVDGRDVEPGFRDPGDYTPRCRVFWSPEGPRGIPPRGWIEDAIRQSLGDS